MAWGAVDLSIGRLPDLQTGFFQTRLRDIAADGTVLRRFGPPTKSRRPCNMRSAGTSHNCRLYA